MELPDGRPLILDEGILAEPPGIAGRLVLWIPGAIEGGFRLWERVGTAAGASVESGAGICFVAATSTPARQRIARGLGGLFRRGTRPGGDRELTMPDGGRAEPSGPRRPGLLLAWTEPGTGAGPLGEAAIRDRWPGCGEVRRIGEGLFLVLGIEDSPASAGTRSDEAAPARRIAEEALTAARRAGDRRREATALADLGLTLLQDGDGAEAWRIFEESLSAARGVGDREVEADALSNLALTALIFNRPDRALEFVGPALAHARESGDRYAEKVAWERLGLAHRGLGDHPRALDCLGRATAIARDLGDRQHEMVLLWHGAIEHAEMGHADAATAWAGASIDLGRRLGKPQAGWYARHLAAYRSSPGGSSLASAGARPRGVGGLDLGGSIDATALAPPLVPSTPGPGQGGPGVLKMAISATRAMATFVGSGFRTIGPEARRARLAACSTCELHTGVRCRACGCITAAKARMAHEDCPAGRWPRP